MPAIGVIGPLMLSQARCTYSVSTTIANKPHPLNWILFATAVARNSNITHICYLLLLIFSIISNTLSQASDLLAPFFLALPKVYNGIPIIAETTPEITKARNVDKSTIEKKDFIIRIAPATKKATPIAIKKPALLDFSNSALFVVFSTCNCLE